MDSFNLLMEIIFLKLCICNVLDLKECWTGDPIYFQAPVKIQLIEVVNVNAPPTGKSPMKLLTYQRDTEDKGHYLI